MLWFGQNQTMVLGAFDRSSLLGLAALSDQSDGWVVLRLEGPRSEEVLARLRALIRRAAGHASSEIVVGDVCLDTKQSRVTYKEQPVKLTSHEFRLLSYLIHHKGEVVSRTELIEHLYDQDFDKDSNTIEVFVGRLRKKLYPEIIETVRGLGYRLQT